MTVATPVIVLTRRSRTRRRRSVKADALRRIMALIDDRAPTDDLGQPTVWLTPSGYAALLGDIRRTAEAARRAQRPAVRRRRMGALSPDDALLEIVTLIDRRAPAHRGLLLPHEYNDLLDDIYPLCADALGVPL